MFSCELQKNEALQTLLSVVGIGWAWSKYGPTGGANVDELSPTEALMLGIANELYDRSNSVSLGDILDELDPAAMEAVGSLLVAYARGPRWVDEWIDRYRGREAMRSVLRAM